MAWTKLGDDLQSLLRSVFDGLSNAVAATYAALLTAVTATGAGTTQDVSAQVPQNHAWAIQVTNATAARIDLEGALNDTAGQYGMLDSYEGIGSTVRYVSGKPARYVRANVVSLTSDVGVTGTVSVQYLGTR